MRFLSINFPIPANNFGCRVVMLPLLLEFPLWKQCSRYGRCGYAAMYAVFSVNAVGFCRISCIALFPEKQRKVQRKQHWLAATPREETCLVANTLTDVLLH